MPTPLNGSTFRCSIFAQYDRAMLDARCVFAVAELLVVLGSVYNFLTFLLCYSCAISHVA